MSVAVREVTTKEGNRRLLVLASFLDKLPPERFNYRTWVGRDWKGAPDLSCGTTGCAMGWAPQIPEFKALGLELRLADTEEEFENAKRHGYEHMVVVDCPPLGLIYDPDKWEHHDNPDRVTFETARAFFAMSSYDDALYLFAPNQPGRTYGEVTAAASPGGEATPSEVADHLRRFVASRS